MIYYSGFIILWNAKKKPSLDGVTDCFVSKLLVIRKILHELKILKEVLSWEETI